MNPKIDTIIDRQREIANGNSSPLPIPKFTKYTIGNLRGGIGKTTLAFNLSYLIDNILMIDTCPQGNLSYFYDENYYSDNATVKELILPYMITGLGKPTRIARKISATNKYFADKNSYYIASSNDLYILPSHMTTAFSQTGYLSGNQRAAALDSILYSLKNEVDREMKEINAERCIIDTSPFFSGATHLSWHATDALILPVRTDQQSINSLNLLINTLSSSHSEFRKYMPSDGHTPKIQLIILTHCAWTTRSGARNEPNQQTKVYVEKIKDIVSRNIQHFTTEKAENHILLLDDFLGTGRISTALSKPVFLLRAGESTRINRIKTTVNSSVEKIQRQIKYISDSIW